MAETPSVLFFTYIIITVVIEIRQNVESLKQRPGGLTVHVTVQAGRSSVWWLFPTMAFGTGPYCPLARSCLVAGGGGCGVGRNTPPWRSVQEGHTSLLLRLHATTLVTWPHLTAKEAEKCSAQ